MGKVLRSGEWYEVNPVTLDARNSGTTATLCGQEQVLDGMTPANH